MTKIVLAWLVVAASTLACWAKPSDQERQEAEYYLAAYAEHYGVPLDFARAIVEQESGWHRCAVSDKGAVGLMQLMPETAKGLGVRDRCNIQQNISGGIRYLALLMKRFRGDLRLVAAAYNAGPRPVGVRGLNYRNREVISYVASVRRRVEAERTQAKKSEVKAR